MSYEHSYTPLLGKTQPMLEHKSMTLPDKNKQKSKNLHLTNNTKHWRRSHQKHINLCQNTNLREIRLTNIALGQIQIHTKKYNLVQLK